MCGIIGIYKYEVCCFFVQQPALFAQPHLLAKYKSHVLILTARCFAQSSYCAKRQCLTTD